MKNLLSWLHGSPALAAERWPLDRELLRFTGSRADAWRVGDACEGTAISGATGSGKTSGSGAKIARSFLRAGFGGLVLCVKKDEPQLWQQYARECGRTDDMVLFGAVADGFNFLEYEQTREGGGAGHTENLVQLFIQVAEIVNQKRSGAEPYWELALKQLLRNAVDLARLAGQSVDLPTIAAIVMSAPQSLAAVKDSAWEESSLTARLLTAAAEQSQNAPDFEMTERYWRHEFPALDNRTRSNVVSTFTTMADSLLRGKMRGLFCGKTTVKPDVLVEGKIIVVDLPVKEYAELGQYAGVIWKYLAQKFLERQDRPDRPVFIWADEAQYFATRYDQLFQTTARAAKVATVYLSQNLPNYLAAFGGDPAAKARVDSLMGNLQTKIFHQNSDSETNEWAARTISKRLHYRTSTTDSAESSSTTAQPTVDFEVQPQVFTMLRKGGPKNDYIVDAVVNQGGRHWSTGRSWIRAEFNQKKI